MLRVEPCDATLGATVRGVSVDALDADAWERIATAFVQYALLIFPGQHLDAEAQRGFACRFGPLETELMGDEPVVVIANTDRAGGVRSSDHPVFHVLRGNEGWHTDSSYMPVSARASVLSAITVPPEGGETEWADMRAAFASLEPDEQDRLEGLAAHHSLRYSQAKAGEAQTSGYGIDVEVEPLRPLVKRHPVTDVPALFVGRHAHGVIGMSAEESEQLLHRLVVEACRPPRLHKHRWRPGDLVVWDNRCLLHRAHPYDYSEARVLWHTRVAGDPVTEAGMA